MSNLETSRAERLDQRVVALLPILSRSFAIKLIEDGKVTVNGKVITKGGHKLWKTDTVVVDYQAEKFTIPDIELPILYEDESVVVINKPSGLLTHSKGAFNPEPSVATWLHNRIEDKDLIAADAYQPNNRAGIVHRLDRATSGVMICAKTQTALTWLQKQFAQRKVKKTYIAIVSGQLANDHAIIEMPIERNPKKPQTFRVGINGKVATSEYEVIASNGVESQLRLTPQTGRTHQLRVHVSHVGHPIVGDEMYGGVPADRLYLHALSLEITLPNRERHTFETDLPLSFADRMK